MDLKQLAEDYRRDGVVRVRSLLSPDEVAEFRERLAAYADRHLASLPADAYTMEPDGKTIRNLWRLGDFEPWFDDLTRRERFASLIHAFIPGELERAAVETFNKPAKVGSAVPWHQDNAYFCRTPPDVLTLWIALDPATIENGAVRYLCGSHDRLRRHRMSGVKGNSFMLDDIPADGEYPEFVGTLEPGDALVHHCQTIHRSDPNQSDNARLGMLIVYKGAATSVDPVLHKAYEAARQSVA